MTSQALTRRFLLDGVNLEDFEQYPFFSKFGNVVIRRLVSGEKDDQDPNAKSVLEITSSDAELIYLASRVVTSFRLLDEGGIGYNREFTSDGPRFIKEYGLPYRPPRGKEDTYKITESKVKEIEKKFKDLDDIIYKQEKSDDSLLRLALGRFNRSYDDVNEDDILIDLMICFEILFVFGHTERQKGDTIADRASKFLLTKYNQQATHDELKCAYDIRNDVVHEGKRYNQVYRLP